MKTLEMDVVGVPLSEVARYVEMVGGTVAAYAAAGPAGVPTYTVRVPSADAERVLIRMVHREDTACLYGKGVTDIISAAYRTYGVAVVAEALGVSVNSVSSRVRRAGVPVNNPAAGRLAHKR